MVHINTSIGFEMDLDESCLNDMELFDSIAEVEKGHMIALPDVVNRIVGGEKQNLYDRIRNEKGHVPIDVVTAQILEIIQQAGGKNS